MTRQEHQAMLQGEHRGWRIPIGILIVAICAAIVEAWHPGALRTIASRIYSAIVYLFGYLGAMAASFRNFLKTIGK